VSGRRFAALRERLLRSGVAPRHARRAVLELRAHHEDVEMELRAAGHTPEQCEALAAERVGSDEAFVRDMLARPELRSFASRRPFVAFTLLPLLGFIALLALSVVLVIGAVEATEHWRALLPPAVTQSVRWLGTALFLAALWLAPIAVGGVVCVLAARQRIAARWAIAGAVLVGLLAAHINGHLEFATPTTRGSIALGVGWGWPHLPPPIARRAAIFIPAVLLPYFWWLWWSRSHGARTGHNYR
jgi:hypothetical protein